MSQQVLFPASLTVATPPLTRVEQRPVDVSVRRPVSPRVATPVSTVSPRLTPVSPRRVVSPVTLKQVEKVVEKVVDMKRDSNDINIILDKVMKLISKYGINSEVYELLKVHRWEYISKVLHRAAFIFAIRMEAIKVLDVLEVYHHFEYLGDEVKSDRSKVVNKLVEAAKELGEEWLAKFRAYH